MIVFLSFVFYVGWRLRGLMKKNVISKSDFESFSDEQIVQCAINGDEKAIEFILNKYKPLVKFRANMYFLIGADKDDLVQEGMIGLFKAVKSFRSKEETTFRAFADVCVRRQIITAIKSATRLKHMPLNSSVSLNKPVGESDSKEMPVIDFIDSSSEFNPEEILIGKESLKSMEEHIVKVLSPYEVSVLKLYLSGRTYPSIARSLNKSVKSIDNALQRVKKKLEDTLLINKGIA